MQSYSSLGSLGNVAVTEDVLVHVGAKVLCFPLCLCYVNFTPLQATRKKKMTFPGQHYTDTHRTNFKGLEKFLIFLRILMGSQTVSHAAFKDY